MTDLFNMAQYDSYKHSGFERIKEIPESWAMKRLKFLIDEVNVRSRTGAEELLSLSKYKGVIKKDSLEERSGGASSLIGYKLVDKNQLVINKMQAVNGLLAVSNLQGITSPDYAVYKPKDNNLIDIHFLNYLLLQPEYLSEFKRRVTGVMEGFIRLYTDDLFDIKVVLPPLCVQESIVRFLNDKSSQIDRAIAIKELQIDRLEERKQVIIEQALSKGLDLDVPNKESGVDWIGKVPSHWEVRKVKHLFDLIMEPSEKNNNHELLSIYTAIGVRPRKDLEAKGNKASTTDGYWLVKKGDFIVNKLLAWMGAIGLSNYEGVTSPAYDILRTAANMDPYFYHYLFRTKKCSGELKKHSRGIMDVRLRLYFDKFGPIYVPYPPVEEQVKIVEYINEHTFNLDESKSLLKEQVEKLKEYKNTLINSAVTGKIKVPQNQESVLS